MNIYIGADYRGLEKEQKLVKKLMDFGVDVAEESACVYSDKNSENDYNDAAIAVAKEVREDLGSFGVLICDSAHGMTMQSNRFKGIRAANCDSVESAKLAREHDDANVVCLSARFLGDDEMWEIVETFLQTDFEPLERRVRRVNRLDERMDY